MVTELLDRLTAPFVFVVGKGGVGKSTTASAVALGLADDGHDTHLVSTDPAHSLGDIFEQRLDHGRPETSRCSERLTLEELDAPRRARRWLDEIGDAVADLFDRGTYLDRGDIVALLDRSLPGMDEVMAALRLAELGASDGDRRVVVDTAPTGHTLRLIDSGRTLAGWVHTFDAMAAKAGAVAAAFSGRRLRFEGEVVIDELRRDVARFTDEVLAGADFVVVTRDGSVVREETTRLETMLAERGYRVPARVVVRKGSGRPLDAEPVRSDSDRLELVVAHATKLVGCTAIRAWGAPTDGLSAAADVEDTTDGQRPPGGDPCRSVGEALPPRALMFFAGKGGVGKSTCAAAYALEVSAQHPVLLLSLDPAGSLTEVLGRPVDSVPSRVTSGLRARQLDAAKAFHAFREAYRDRVERVFERLGLEHSVDLDRRVIESLLDVAPPGLDEIFALDAVLDVTGNGETVVVDTAPTGHFLRVLDMPEVALAWTRQMVRVLLKYRSVLGVDDFARELLDFSKRLEALVEQMADPSECGVVVVTLAEDLALRETDRLLDSMRQREVPVAALVLNRVTGASDAAHAPSAGTDVLALEAPEVAESPVGVERLRAFVGAWRCA